MFVGSSSKCKQCNRSSLVIEYDENNPLRQLVKCSECQHIEELRRTDIHSHKIEIERDDPLFVVTTDLEKFSFPNEIEGDPYCAGMGFITAFSQLSVDRLTAMTCSTSTSSGAAAEYQRVLSPFMKEAHRSDKESSSRAPSKVKILSTAYCTIGQIIEALELEHSIQCRAFDMFSQGYTSKRPCYRNIGAAAAACVVLALREKNITRSLREVANAADITQKELGRQLSQFQKYTQLSPSGCLTNNVNGFLPRFSQSLELDYKTLSLAKHIVNETCARNMLVNHHPSSVSAAAIYFASQLTGVKRTQSEVSKATLVSEVTLRKVHKELLAHGDSILPQEYKKCLVDTSDEESVLKRLKPLPLESPDDNMETESLGNRSSAFSVDTNSELVQAASRTSDRVLKQYSLTQSLQLSNPFFDTVPEMDLLSSEFTVDDEEETDEPLDLHHPLLPDPDQPTIDSFLSLTSFSTKDSSSNS